MSHMGEYPALPTALEHLDPWTSRNAFAFEILRGFESTTNDPRGTDGIR